MLYRKDVFAVFVYISIFGIRTKIFRNLTIIWHNATNSPPYAGRI